MLNSLKQITTAFETWCLSRPKEICAEFICDDYSRFATDNHEYPLVWLMPLRMKVVNGMVTWVFNIAFIDKPVDDKIKTLSDLGMTAGEFLTAFNENSDGFLFNIHMDSSFQSFFKSVDGTTGWQGEISVQTPFAQDASRTREL
jgi:hypothetical protein